MLGQMLGLRLEFSLGAGVRAAFLELCHGKVEPWEIPTLDEHRCEGRCHGFAAAPNVPHVIVRDLITQAALTLSCRRRPEIELAAAGGHEDANTGPRRFILFALPDDGFHDGCQRRVTGAEIHTK